MQSSRSLIGFPIARREAQAWGFVRRAHATAPPYSEAAGERGLLGQVDSHLALYKHTAIYYEMTTALKTANSYQVVEGN